MKRGLYFSLSCSLVLNIILLHPTFNFVHFSQMMHSSEVIVLLIVLLKGDNFGLVCKILVQIYIHNEYILIKRLRQENDILKF